MWKPFVANRQTAWLIYSEAKLWGTRPSVLLDIQDTYVAYCFDQAIGYWGVAIESAMDEVEGKNAKDTAAKRQAVLKRFLYPDDSSARQGRFADPAIMFA